MAVVTQDAAGGGRFLAPRFGRNGILVGHHRHDIGGDLVQQVQFRILDLARFAVHQAQGAQHVAVGRAQRRSDIEPSLPLAQRRVVRKPHVAVGVGHDQRVVGGDDVIAHRLGPRHPVHARLGFRAAAGQVRALADDVFRIGIDRGDEGQTDIEHIRRALGQIVQILARAAVQDRGLGKGVQTRGLVRGGRGACIAARSAWAGVSHWTASSMDSTI